VKIYAVYIRENMNEVAGKENICCRNLRRVVFGKFSR